jgi:hypothetical protein
MLRTHATFRETRDALDPLAPFHERTAAANAVRTGQVSRQVMPSPLLRLRFKRGAIRI